MCGIVGCIGKKDVVCNVLSGLETIEYRGYDSAGIVCRDENTQALVWVKACGDLIALKEALGKKPLHAPIALGHTRWATHGGVTTENTHPHFDCHHTIALVHNGIIENYRVLRAELESRGHVFRSQTDTEAIAHLLEEKLKTTTSPKEALLATVKELEGSFALAILLRDLDDTLLFVRNRSPLCIGLGEDSASVVSDMLSFDESIQKYAIIPDQTVGIVRANFCEVYNFDGSLCELTYQPFVWLGQLKNKKNYAHYMLKEIHEQKQVIIDVVKYVRTLGNVWHSAIGLQKEDIQKLESIFGVACGTSYHAACMAHQYMRSIAHIHSFAERASEFLYQPDMPLKNCLYYVLSQSGETADTLEALRMLKKSGQKVLGIINVPTSSMARESTGILHMNAGLEVAVASTKSFTVQVVLLYWLAYKIAQEKGLVTALAVEKAENDLLVCAQLLDGMIDKYQATIDERAPYYASFSKYIFLGRQESFAFAQEAALKLKELAYIFVEAYQAGELKHGPLALVDATMPVVIFSSLDPIIYRKLLSNVQEVKARGGIVIAFAFEGQEELIKVADESFVFPVVATHLGPLVMVSLMQYWVYRIALSLGRSIDKPRNLAKSVTVE